LTVVLAVAVSLAVLGSASLPCTLAVFVLAAKYSLANPLVASPARDPLGVAVRVTEVRPA
jgi:hypothetical protein